MGLVHRHLHVSLPLLQDWNIAHGNKTARSAYIGWDGKGKRTWDIGHILRTSWVIKTRVFLVRNLFLLVSVMSCTCYCLCNVSLPLPHHPQSCKWWLSSLGALCSKNLRMAKLYAVDGKRDGTEGYVSCDKMHAKLLSMCCLALPTGCIRSHSRP